MKKIISLGLSSLLIVTGISVANANEAQTSDSVAQDIAKSVYDNKSFFANPKNVILVGIGFGLVESEMKHKFHIAPPPQDTCSQAVDLAYKQGATYKMQDGKLVYGPALGSTGGISMIANYVQSNLSTVISPTDKKSKQVFEVTADSLSFALQTALSADVVAIQAEERANKDPKNSCDHGAVDAMQYMDIIAEQIPLVLPALESLIDQYGP